MLFKIMTKQIIKNKVNHLFKLLDETAISKIGQTPEIRGVLFSLEGILRIHVKNEEAFKSKQDSKTIRKALLRLKALEDSLGQFSYAFEIKDYAKEKGIYSKKLDRHVKKANHIFKKNFKKQVRDIKSSSKELSKITWPDKDQLLRLLSMEIRRTDTKISVKLKPLINKSKYSDYEIQEGLHEWRRAIRWISIYYQSYKNIFRIEPKPNPNKKEQSLIKKYRLDPFCLLGKTKSAISVSNVDFYLLSDFIKKVGDIKVEAEIPRSLNKIGIKAKSSFSEKNVHNLFKEYEKSEVLDKLYKSLILNL